MFENLTERFDRAFKVLKGHGQITEINVAETLKEVRRALLEADVSFNTAKAFSLRIKEKALGQNVLNSISPGQLLVKITQEELLEAGVHFGHLKIKWNPNMAPFIYMERNGIHIINLYKTVAKIEEASEALKKIAAKNRSILL